jgi:hypothetical protein
LVTESVGQIVELEPHLVLEVFLEAHATDLLDHAYLLPMERL